MRGSTQQLSLFPPSVGSRPVTIADLELYCQRLKEELLKEIRVMVQDQPKPPPAKWLKNKAAAALLGISVRTLQDIRDKGIVPHSRIGRTIYYDPEDIDREIERRKGRGRHHPEFYTTKSCPTSARQPRPTPSPRKKHPTSNR